jgi:hypothetical protein
MSLRLQQHKQAGAVYVEAAIILPVLLLVTFTCLFFFLLAARQFSVQMLANEIAKDISLSLQTNDDNFNASHGVVNSCIKNCRTNCRGGENALRHTRNLTAYVACNSTYPEACWNTCARDQFLLNTEGDYPMSVTATAYPARQWFDSGSTPTVHTTISAGDLFDVTVSYPFRAVWGGGIAFFGLVPDKNLTGVAVGIVEKRENSNQEVP